MLLYRAKPAIVTSPLREHSPFGQETVSPHLCAYATQHGALPVTDKSPLRPHERSPLDQAAAAL